MIEHDAPPALYGDSPVDHPTYREVDVPVIGLTLRVWDTDVATAEWHQMGDDSQTEDATDMEYELGRLVLAEQDRADAAECSLSLSQGSVDAAMAKLESRRKE